MPLAGESELSAISKDPQVLMRIPVGAASPLWGLFAGAAMSGAAWWWMTRWTRPANLEALFGAAEAMTTEAIAEVEALAAPVVEAAAAALEPVAEASSLAPIAGTPVEAAPQPVGEAAPISSLLEAAAPEAAEEPLLEPTTPSKPKRAAAQKTD